MGPMEGTHNFTLGIDTPNSAPASPPRVSLENPARRYARAKSRLGILPPVFGLAQRILGRDAMAETYSNISI